MQGQARYEAVRSYDGTGRYYVVDNHEQDLSACRKSDKMAYQRAAKLAEKLNREDR